MNLEKVVFGFFIILALTLNFGFVLGEIDHPAHHNVWELFAAIVVNLVATVLKFGDRTQTGALLLATSLVAILQLLAAAIVWGYAVNISAGGLDAMMMASIVSLAAGAVVANVISVVLLIADTVNLRR
jgi:Ca2+/H+ antiporter, TMEM165/GDT1 family